MKKVTYICDLCGKEYDTEEKELKCKRSHTVPHGIYKFNKYFEKCRPERLEELMFNIVLSEKSDRTEMTKYPNHIFVKMSDGKIVRYELSCKITNKKKCDIRTPIFIDEE